MKRVPSLTAEPIGLAQWCAEHPNDVQATGDAAKSAWNEFKGSGETYHAVLSELLAGQQGLCGYCEQRLTRPSGDLVVNDYQIEHVLPNSGEPNSGEPKRVLEWTNLMLCCGGGTWKHHGDSTRYQPPTRTNLSCGQSKADDELPASCDPRSFPWAESLVSIGIDGRMRAKLDACERAGVDSATLQSMIDERLGLNCERLRLARESVVNNLLSWVNDLFDWALSNAPNLPDDTVERMRAELAGGRLGPDAHGYLRPFWTTERQYLGDPAEAWIQAHTADLNF